MGSSQAAHHADADGALVRRHGQRQRQSRQLRAGVFARRGPVGGGARAADERVALERETGVLNEVAANMERSAKNIELQFSAIIGEEMTGLRRALQAVVDAHAAKERDVLIATLEAGRAPRTWTLEGVALRRALAAEFKDCFDRAAARVLELQGKVAPELARLMSLIAPEIAMPAEPEKRLLLIPPPSMAALSRFVALDIEDSWWSSLWKGRTSAERLRRADREPHQDGVPSGRRRPCRHRRTGSDAPTR